MPCAKFNVTLEADSVQFNRTRIHFYNKMHEIIASYPTEYTIIENIK